MTFPALLTRLLQAPGRGGDTGTRRIGYVGHDVPIELILAADATPLGLSGIPGQATSQADRYLEPTFSPSSRSIAEQWLTGGLDDLTAVVFSRSDDSAQRLYYYVCELQRRGRCGGPAPLMYDIASAARSTSLAHTIESTRALAAQLGSQERSLSEAVLRVRDRMALLTTLSHRRAGRAYPPGSLAHRALHASRVDWSVAFDQALRAWLDALRDSDSTAGHRVLLVGSTTPDERIHEAIESAGAAVVGTIDASMPWETSDAAARDPIESVAERCYSSTRRTRDLMQSPGEFASLARVGEATAVVLWTVTEDTGLAWVTPRIEHAFRDRGMPVLTLTMQPWETDASGLRTISDFVTGLERRA
jgi:2-hydroxyglutaryl-CoA dehydratase, D-component